MTRRDEGSLEPGHGADERTPIERDRPGAAAQGNERRTGQAGDEAGAMGANRLDQLGRPRLRGKKRRAEACGSGGSHEAELDAIAGSRGARLWLAGVVRLNTVIV